MSNPTEKDAVAKALYLEFRKGMYTFQIVLVPETLTMDKSAINRGYTMSRKISLYHPRRNWGFDAHPQMGFSRSPEGEFNQVLDERSATQHFADKIVRSIRTTVNSLMGQGWEMYKHPITVEVTYKDINQIKDHKTPIDLYRRITRSRDAFGFGESLLNPEATV